MIVAIIPARLESTRLPRKMLLDVAGRPLVVATWARVVAAGVADRVFVATDSDEIAAAAAAGGAPVVRTGPCANGTARVAEAARSLGVAETDVVLNVQGDEPLVSAATLHAIVAGVRENAEIATGAAELPADEAENPARVKVVCAAGRALYFSRAAIPHGGPWRVHVGVYAFTHAAVQRVVRLPEHPLEAAERLEQLRWLAAGEGIAVVPVDPGAPSVDTADDLAAVIALLRAGA